MTKSRGPTIAATLRNYTCKSFIKLTSCFTFVVKGSGVSHAPRERPGRETRFLRLSIRGRHNFQNPSGNSALFFTKHEVKSIIGLASFHTQMCWPILVDCSRIHFIIWKLAKISRPSSRLPFSFDWLLEGFIGSRKSWQEFFSHGLFFYIPLASHLGLVCLRNSKMTPKVQFTEK